MVIDVRYTFATASPHGNGIGYSIIRRVRDSDTGIVDFKNIGTTITSELNGIGVAKNDQVFFRFHASGDPTGDITRAQIVITRCDSVASPSVSVQPR